MQWAGVGMWMVFGLSACSPTKTEIGNLNVIPQPQEVSQDIQAHPFVINPQTGIVYPEGNEKLQRTAEFLASYIKEATGITAVSITISEPNKTELQSYSVFCLKKKKTTA